MVGRVIGVRGEALVGFVVVMIVGTCGAGGCFC
jgi:hypothetical protein